MAIEIDPTSASAAADLLSAISALTPTGGVIYVKQGALNMGTSTLEIPIGVQVRCSGGGAQDNWTYTNTKGTRFYWTGAATGTGGHCVLLRGIGSALTDCTIFPHTNQTANSVSIGRSTGLSVGAGDFMYQTIFQRVRIIGGPKSTTIWNLAVNDISSLAMSDVVVGGYCNGILFTTPYSSFHLGNTHVHNVQVLTCFPGTTGIMVASREHGSSVLGGGFDLSTFTQLNTIVINAPDSSTTIAQNAVGSVGLHLRGIWNCTFINPDIENYGINYKLSATTNFTTRNNTIINPTGGGAGTFSTKNVDCASNCPNNTFIGGEIGVPNPAIYTAYAQSSLADDLTLRGSPSNIYFGVKATGAASGTSHAGLHLCYQNLQTKVPTTSVFAGVVIPMSVNSYVAAIAVGTVVAFEKAGQSVIHSSSTNPQILGVAQQPHVNGVADTIAVQVSGDAPKVKLSTEGNVAIGDNLYISTASGQQGTVNNAANVGGAPAASRFFGFASSNGTGSGGTVRVRFGMPYRPS